MVVCLRRSSRRTTLRRTDGGAERPQALTGPFLHARTRGLHRPRVTSEPRADVPSETQVRHQQQKNCQVTRLTHRDRALPGGAPFLGAAALAHRFAFGPSLRRPPWEPREDSVGIERRRGFRSCRGPTPRMSAMGAIPCTVFTNGRYYAAALAWLIEMALRCEWQPGHCRPVRASSDPVANARRPQLDGRRAGCSASTH